MKESDRYATPSSKDWNDARGEAITYDDPEDCVSENKSLLPSLHHADSTGVKPLSVDKEAVDACVTYCKKYWNNGVLKLDQQSARGFKTYPKVIGKHDPKEQEQNTIILPSVLLPIARKSIPGFARMEEVLVHHFGGNSVELVSAHMLKQSPQTQHSTGFALHRDDEQDPSIAYTVVVKLTPDEAGKPPSAMRVAGASRHFEYGADAGSAGCFLARLYHASVAPKAPTEHLKLAFFFRHTSMRAIRSEKRKRMRLTSTLPTDRSADSPSPPGTNGSIIELDSSDDEYEPSGSQNSPIVLH